jgi:cellulose synthase/poly-beta-1,6-N-acetylglucosamine synthase-like glycosyltransferase/peptidoglycan/xylan/chitin deacetylase (PgdA/CDA1 family)/spore germination protein YaaH
VNPEQEKSIFADPRGVRRRILQVVVFFSALFLLVAAGSFIWGLLIRPQLTLPSIVRNYREQLRALPSAKLPVLDSKDNWRRIQSSVKEPVSATHPAKPKPTGIVLGYVSDWDPASLLSLEHHGDQLTHVASDWFSLSGVESNLIEEPSNQTRLFCVRRGIGFLPILRNLDGDTWQPEAVESLTRLSQQDRSLFLDKLVSRLPPGSTGLILEWNELDPTYKAETSQLVKELADHLHAAGKELWFTVPTGHDFDAFDMDVISDAADRLVATLYDENSEADDPGPIADSSWFEGWLKTMMVYGDPDQWVIAMGNYAYDWRKDNHSVMPLGFTDVMARAAQAEVNPSLVDSSADSPHFNYSEGDKAPREHEVWFLDAVTLFNQRRISAPYHPGGIGIYRLGEEDPAVWDLLRLDISTTPDAKTLASLSQMNLDEQIASTGSGDFITAGDDPYPGERQVTLTPEGNLFERYVKFPMPESITRQGDPGPHQVALTFDDGPDPTWTPKILQILKDKGVQATFMALGTQIQEYPDLLERIAADGHEIGNHTYTHQNVAEESDEQIDLELNATTRLIEAVTGHSTAYFRPPYNSDGTPSQPGEMKALRVARDLGYLTVTQSIDPDDWERPGADAIVARVKAQRAAGGSVILLHDAGGDRSQTVAALPRIIDYLHARGDVIVPLSSIIGLSRDTVMPPLREENQPFSARYVYRTFAVIRFLENTAWTLLVVVTLLALLRVSFLGICSFRHHRLEKIHPVPEPDTFPPLSVLLAAYNEERVIASTIRHLLDSDYPAPIEIVVVDDGSKDQTASVVAAIASHEDSVQLIQQPNGGKSTALNRALAESSHQVIIMIDADTMVAPDGLRKLVAPLLADPAVGAVSGTIRVGNTHPWLGKFQDLEYVAAFEIDRRAQDLLGCIIVAPGALSAFRREAVEQAGALNTDTLAEDTDLTLQLHKHGWKIVFAPRAYADTEAPEHVKALISQRFRWAYGTLQCLWKHAEILFAPGSGWLGWFALPSVWLFQIVVVAITPILDILVLCSLLLGRGAAIWPYFVASLLLDVVLAVIALRLAGRAWQIAWRGVPMRLLYRPLLGYVVWKCIVKAMAGSWVRWSKLDRTAGAIQQKEQRLSDIVRNP